MIFVFGEDNRFLLPVTRIKMARTLLLNNKAEIISQHPLTLRLKLDTSHYSEGSISQREIYERSKVHPALARKNIFLKGNAYKWRSFSSMLTLHEISKNLIYSQASSIVKRDNGLVNLNSFAANFDQGAYSMTWSCEGIGSKLFLCDLFNKVEVSANDLVAHNVNNCVCSGTLPAYMLCYISHAREDEIKFRDFSYGLKQACVNAGLELIGEKTTQHQEPSPYCITEAVGSCIGSIPKSYALDGSKIKPNDIILGFPSTGLHSSGYTLAEQILFPNPELKSQAWHLEQKRRLSKETPTELQGQSIREALLAPVRSYVGVLKTIRYHDLPEPSALINITEGGVLNLLRTSVNSVKFVLDQWPRIPGIFTILKDRHNLRLEEMFANFNMGIGMCMVIQAHHLKLYLPKFRALGYPTHVVGYVKQNPYKAIEIHNENLTWQR